VRSKLEVYALAVCFAAVVCLVISAGIGGYAVIRIIQPELTMKKWDCDQYQSNDVFWQSRRYGTAEERKLEQRPAEENLTERRLESFKRALSVERRDGVQTLIQCAMFFLAGAVSLLVHWRIARRAREESAA
jgi:hypothetical protein